MKAQPTSNGIRALTPSLSLADRARLQISELIEEGRIEVGAQLPGERQLGEQLGISRNVIREALSQLETMGAVSVQPGRGTFVVAKPGTALARLNQIEWLNRGKADSLQLLEVRECLEVRMARFAAERATEDDVAALREAHLAHQAACNARQLHAIIATDRAFHQCLTDCAHNAMLTSLLHDLQTMNSETAQYVYMNGHRMEHSMAEHGAILDAISRSDPDLAEQAVYRHIENTRRDVVASQADPGEFEG